MQNILVTPTFAPDFERCKAMLESAEQYISGVEEHLLLVDKSDLSLFQKLQNNRIRVICKNEVLPAVLFQVPLQKRWWLTDCSPPVRGWILQQIIKLAVAKGSQADAVIFADSDLIFVRNLSLNDLWSGNQLRLFRTERQPNLYSDKRYKNWYGFSCKALALGNPQAQTGAYITQLATMRPNLTRMLCNALENKFSKPWYETLLNTWDFSEYILYGVFVENLLKETDEKNCGHYLSGDELCHSSWFYDIHSKVDIDEFVAKTTPQHCAVHLQSNLYFDPSALSNAIGSLN